MKKISLNFYGEEILIQCPKDFASLKKEIAEKYQLSLSDIFEIDISYEKLSEKKIIKSEIDFKTFLHSKVSNISLNINESSKLFQKGLSDLQAKSKDDLAQLELLKKKKEENKKKQEVQYHESKKKIDDLNNEIKLLGQRKLEYVKSIKKLMRGPRNKEKELVAKITKLGNEIGAPLIFKIPEKGPLPIKEETEKEKKLVELIKRNTNCLDVQEKLYATPRKNMANMDKQIKEINKKCLNIIKSSQKEMMELKKEENNLIREIISLEKKLGLSVDEKKPMKKYGFYFPNRDPCKIETVKKEEEKIKLKGNKPELSLPCQKDEKRKINKKIENVVSNLRKNIKEEVQKNIMKTNTEIKKIREKAEENKNLLNEEDEKYLEKCEKENDKAIKEVDKWIKFIFLHSHELIEAAEKQSEVNSEKLGEISKKIGLKISKESKGGKIAHPGIKCSECNEPIVGIRYKCSICKDFDYCEKCEEKTKGGHGHPFLKIYKPDMCPIDFKCVLKNEQ